MYKPLTEEQISFMEQWYNPIANIECLAPEELKAPQKWSNSPNFKCVKVRNYQHTMVDYSMMYADDPRKSPEENARIKRVVGTCYNIAARDVGKSYLLWLDAFTHLIHARGGESMLAAPTDEKLKKVGGVLVNLCQNHPFFKIFHKSGKTNGISKSPLEIGTQRGHTLYGRNEKIDDPDPGKNFNSVHAQKIFYEEFSFATAKGALQRVDSENSLGCIERMSGIPDLKPGSPLGDVINNKKLKSFICRLPQSFRRDWNKATRQRKIDKYKGRYSVSYKLNVDGEILEGAFSKWDMDRIRNNCLKTDKHIKFYEINKEIFKGIEDFQENKDSEKELLKRLGNALPLTRVPSTKRVIASDIGTTGSPSEVGIFFGNKNSNFIYEYQISLFKMTSKEQAFVFNWLYRVIDGAFICVDNSNADGKDIVNRLVLEYKIPRDQISDYDAKSNTNIGYKLDEKDKVVKDDKGKPIEEEVYTKKWAVQQLETIFYDGKIEIPYDEKFLEQFANHFEKPGISGRPTWGSSADEHLVDMFLCFAFCVWDKCWRSTSNLSKNERPIGYI